MMGAGLGKDRRQATRNRVVAMLLLIVAAAVVPGFCQEIPQKHIHLRGSSSFFAITQEVAEAFMRENPDSLVVVSSGGTTRGIKAVIDGTADVAVTSSLLNEELELLAREKEVTLETHIVARGAIVPVVHPSNPIQSLTMGQLQRVFSGQISEWKLVGGNEEPIQLTTNEAVRGAFETWKRCVMGREVVIASSALVLPPKQLRKFIADHPNAIGYMSFADTDASVKPLAVEGISATVETVSRAEFPIRRDHALLVRENPPDIVKKFIAFFLDPRKGQASVVAHGASPALGGGEKK